MDKLSFSIAEATRATGLSRSKLYELMSEGRLGYLKAGRRRLIRREHLERLLDSLER
jgi:excisionase family DNA binding protein